MNIPVKFDKSLLKIIFIIISKTSVSKIIQKVYNRSLRLEVMALLKAGISLIIVIMVIIGGYYIYSSFLSGEIKEFKNAGYNADVKDQLANVSGEVNQFYKNMRFNHNKISYYINPECSNDKKREMERAFEILSIKVNNLITFYSSEENNADILVGCSPNSYEKEENIFIVGEGGPTKIVNSSLPVIERGKVLLYSDSRSDCENPNLELHELFHVFGYDHINEPTDIMYPYLDCEQEIKPKLIDHMVQLYSIEPFAELYFGNISAYMEKYLGKDYLNFNITINNDGIIDAENVGLEVRVQNKSIKSFELENIKFGAAHKLYVKNLALPYRSSKIEFIIVTTSKEPNAENNRIELEV